jgi:hypothetical protein
MLSRQAMTQRPAYEAFGINIEIQGDTTHIFKHGVLIGSFTIDIAHQTLKFNFPGHKFFNYFAYIASDKPSNRVKWVNENLGQDTMDNLQAGVAFLGFAKFEELMALALHQPEEEGIKRDDQPAIH